jgi:hypothetical protein
MKTIGLAESKAYFLLQEIKPEKRFYFVGPPGFQLEAFCGRERSGSPQPKSRA